MKLELSYCKNQNGPRVVKRERNVRTKCKIEDCHEFLTCLFGPEQPGVFRSAPSLAQISLWQQRVRGNIPPLSFGDFSLGNSRKIQTILQTFPFSLNCLRNGDGLFNEILVLLIWPNCRDVLSRYRGRCCRTYEKI